MHPDNDTPGGFHYGAAKKAHLEDDAKQRNLQAAVLCFIEPVALFAAIFALASCPLRCDYAWLIWIPVIIGLGLVGPCAYVAALAISRKTNSLLDRQPTWYVFIAVTAFAALAAALVLGEVNYRRNVRPVCDLDTLGVYLDVDVGRPGTHYMDAGHVIFKQGTRLDLSKAVGFRNKDQYCVAPIVTGNASTNARHDFWAVGINCCAGKPADFKCGEQSSLRAISSSRRAISGVRLLNEDHQASYRRAVEEAEQSFGVNSSNPVFFAWSQDPLAKRALYLADARDFYYMSVCACAAMDLVLIIWAFVFGCCHLPSSL